MLSIEERLSKRNGDAQGEGEFWTAWKETMGGTLLSPPFSREKGTDRGGKDDPRVIFTPSVRTPLSAEWKV